MHETAISINDNSLGEKGGKEKGPAFGESRKGALRSKGKQKIRKSIELDAMARGPRIDHDP